MWLEGTRPAPLVRWVHQDGRQIVVYATHKVRLGYTTKDRGGSAAPLCDEWPILYREDVGELTDAEWLQMPCEAGWRTAE